MNYETLASQAIDAVFWLSVVYWILRPAAEFGIAYCRHRLIVQPPPQNPAAP